MAIEPMAPSVSVLIPAYESGSTIGRTLASLRNQTLPPAQVVVVDSNPADTAAAHVRGQFPKAVYRHSPTRLLPHAARNLALELSRGDLVACIDPDAVAHPGWLENLVSVYLERGGAVCGAVECLGRGWTERGLHLAKFDKWLPGGKVRRMDIGPTVSLLLSRADLERAGGWEGRYMIGDTLLSWRLKDLGVPLWFAPRSIVEHEHAEAWSDLLREMHSRGREFGYLRRRLGSWHLPRVLLMTALSILPLRLVKILARVLWNAARAGQLGTFVYTFPIILTGHVARMAGEVEGYFGKTGG